MLEPNASLNWYNYYKKIILKIEISKIKIGKRLRKEQGDIDELAESIKEYGLLSPIIIRRLDDDSYKLLAGWRRIYAVKALQVNRIHSKIT